MKQAVSVDKREWRSSPLPGQVVLVTTIDGDGRANLAPKSWVSMAAFGPPPVLMFGCNLDHATARNALATREFVVNVPGDDLVAACWAVGDDAAGPDRFARAGLTPVPSTRVRAPRIAECRAHLECELEGTREWGREVILFGRIVAAAIDGAALEGAAAARYRALAPFFFLEDGLAAGLGGARPVRGDAAARHVLTILAVADLERSARFYRDAFGWPARVEVPVYVEFDLPDGRGVGLYRREGFGRNTGQVPAALPPGAIAGTELYFCCDDLDAAVARLAAAGARPLSPRSPRDWGDEAAYYADPDGNVVVVARPLPARREG